MTSGLLILALNAESAAEFFRLFAEHHIQKTYLALSNQKPKKKQGLIVGDMQKARNGAWKLCPSKENPAITRFESVSCEPNLRLFILKPQTGKTHQLRVAMKSLGSQMCIRDRPLANAANNNARFDKLFEPGKLISPSMREIGFKVIAFITRPPFYFYTQKYDHRSAISQTPTASTITRHSPAAPRNPRRVPKHFLF